jgi:hypothetical protein
VARAPAIVVQRPRLPTWPPHDPAEWPTVSRSVRAAAEHPTAPLLVVGLIGLFLLVQHHIDRGDPKLAAGYRSNAGDLRFGAPVRRETSV